VVWDYYRYLSLQICYDILPIMVLVSTLLTFALLARANEVTAFKAVGVSLYRIALPALVGAALLAVGAAFFQAEVLPASNQQVVQLKDRIHGRTVPRTFVPSRQWVVGSEGKSMFHFLRAEPERGRLAGLEVFEFDENRRVSRRIRADEALWTEESGWLLSGGWVRELEGSQVRSFVPIAGPTPFPFPEKPAYFAGDSRNPAQMRARELRAYIETLEARGENVPDLEVELQDKRAFPFSSFVMALVALPFGFRLERKGALYGLGVALAVGMVYIAVYAIFSTLGTIGAIPPIVAVWSPSALFGLLSVYLFLGVRT
jgi:LPS export ABC transporter permease LptG